MTWHTVTISFPPSAFVPVWSSPDASGPVCRRLGDGRLEVTFTREQLMAANAMWKMRRGAMPTAAERAAWLRCMPEPVADAPARQVTLI